MAPGEDWRTGWGAGEGGCEGPREALEERKDWCGLGAGLKPADWNGRSLGLPGTPWTTLEESGEKLEAGTSTELARGGRGEKGALRGWGGSG